MFYTLYFSDDYLLPNFLEKILYHFTQNRLKKLFKTFLSLAEPLKLPLSRIFYDIKKIFKTYYIVVVITVHVPRFFPAKQNKNIKM